jgi:competence protein ComEA
LEKNVMHHVQRFTTLLGLFVTLLTLAAQPATAAPADEAPKAPKPRMVNVNTAEATQLALLPRVGPSTAQRIVEFRKKNGPFKNVEDLMLVQGIGERTFALLKPYVATSGETTLAEKVRAGRAKAKAAAKPDPKPEEDGER